MDGAGVLRIIFIGSSKFGLRCLERVIRVPDVQVVGVVTAGRSFKISYAPSGVTNVLHADFESFAALRDIPVLFLKDSPFDPSLFTAVEELTPDAFVVVGWYHMIPRRWRELAPAFGLHASLLPDYSGGAPLVWAMINGETKTGITLFQMDDGVDSGPIAAQAEEPIRSDDTIATLYARIEERGLELLDVTLPRLVSRDLVFHPQPNSGRRVLPQRSPEDGRIDWSCDAAFIDRWIRAQTRPYPGAFTDSPFGRLTIWASRPLTQRPSNALPGLVFRINCGDLMIACGSGSIQATDVILRRNTYGEAIASEDINLVGTVLG
jgi:methionyl-tRNA formyltransferase